MEEVLAAREMNAKLVASLEKIGVLRSPEIRQAFERVLRHEFVPGATLDEAYADAPVPIKRDGGMPISGASQPRMVALMLERLGLRPGHRVLEIGAGTGYNAALMAELVGPSGAIVTLDLDEDIVVPARERLSKWKNVRVERRDGALGFAEAAPFDRVILTVGAWEIAPAWHEQLATDGRLLIPLWVRGFELCAAFERRAERLESVTLDRCGFQRLRGDSRGPEGHVLLDAESMVFASVENADELDVGAAWKSLATHDGDVSIATGVTDDELAGLALWVSLRRSDFAMFGTGRGRQLAMSRDWPFVSGPFAGTFGLLGPAGATLVVRSEAGIATRAHGTDSVRARALSDEIRAWLDAGRPTLANYRIDVLPRRSNESAAIHSHETLIDKRSTTLCVGLRPPAG